jgi:threonine/homoserine/homoserine lactone efflux protein
VPSAGTIGAFVALAAVIVIVPGPSVLFIVSRAVAHGRTAALLTVVGNTLGVGVVLVVVASGVGAIVGTSEAAALAVRLAGAAYLAWLGLSAIRHRAASAQAAVEARDAGPVGGRRRVVREGFVVGLLNPKAAVFFAAVLPQFTVAGGLPAGVQMLLLGLLFLAVGVVFDSLWAIAAGTARDWLADSGERLEAMAVGGGVIMIGLATWTAVDGALIALA